ncbi:sugar transferase [Patescibacteria group bacterium]|nr:sugar transferase [Patescibacteria group bacterium]
MVYQSEALGKIVALEYKASKLDNRSVVIKRVFDILTASFAIVLLSPLLLIIGIIIKLDSPGPMLYIQKRVGKYGELFTFIKFRSMYTHL